MLINIEATLVKVIASMNCRKKPDCLLETVKKSFESCFVRKGEKKMQSEGQKKLGTLSYGNDWKMLVDFEDKQIVFPPTICATSLRPDIVIWSKLTRVVVLIELTCCIEEGIAKAQVRKENRYAELLEEINSSNWKASLLTLEIGARGLVGSRTYRAFVNLGIPPTKANKLCKTLSCVAARCSYAIYLAHKNVAWQHKMDLVLVDDDDKDASEKKPTVCLSDVKPTTTTPNIVYLKEKGINVLYHFTSATNLDSIRKNGLMSASSLEDERIPSMMNSSELSRKLDKLQGLETYVRLSLNDNNPMRFKVVQEKRVSNVVMLQINLEVVSRPGVLFFDCNATRRGATRSTTPDVVRFEVVKAKNQYAVDANLKHFYQAEVLVPSPIPPHLINFPDSKNIKFANSSSRLPPTAKTATPSTPTVNTKRSSEAEKKNVSVKTTEKRVTHARMRAVLESATEVVPIGSNVLASHPAVECTGLDVVATAETALELPKDLVCSAGEDEGNQCVSPCSEIGTLHARF